MKKIISCLCMVFALLLCTSAYAAGVQEKTVEAKGSASNRDLAIKNALIEALGKVTGVYVDATQINSVAALSVSEDTKENGELTSKQENALVDQQQNDIASQVNGHIKSYSIINEQASTINPGYVDVTISAVISYYEAEKAVERKKIAVMPFRPLSDNNPNEMQFIEELNQGTVSFLTQTRNFAILDRNYLQEKHQEFDLLLGDDVKGEERARIGNTVGTDYILVGSVTNFNATAKAEKVPYVNEEVLIVRGNASISWRLINAPTGMIMASSEHDETFKERVNSETDLDWIAKLARPAGEKIGAKISDIIYPILVVANNNGILTLARGGDSIKVGQKFNLVKYGNIIKDPYTNEAIGRDELKIGTVEITDVTPKLSHAKILQSDTEITTVNTREYIVRPIQGQVNEKKKEPVKTMKPKW